MISFFWMMSWVMFSLLKVGELGPDKWGSASSLIVGIDSGNRLFVLLSFDPKVGYYSWLAKLFKNLLCLDCPKLTLLSSPFFWDMK